MKTKILRIKLAFLAATAVLGVNAQTPGDLDMTFGTNGVVLTDHIANTGEVFLDMITLSDDKIVMVGYSDGANQDIILAKYDADGNPDSTFGINGFQSIDASLGANEEGWAVKELSDGKLLVTGIIVGQTSWDGFIMRLNSDGSVDNSFGTTASGRTNFNAGDNTIAVGKAIEVLGDNSILVGGSALFNGQSDMVVFKFSQGGGLAVSFASGGHASVDMDGENDEVYAMTLTPAEEIILAGVSDSVGVQRGAIVKLTSFGTPSTFNNNMSYYAFDMGSGFNELNDVAVDANGKLVAVGDEGASPDINGIIMRFNADGTMDNSFSSDGIQVSDPGATTRLYLMNVFIDSNGGVLTTGFTVGSSTQEVYAFLMTSSGSPDGNFGGNGDVNYPLTSVTNTMNGRCSAVQSNGAILIGGDVTGQDFIGNNLFLLRLYGIDLTGIGESFANDFSLLTFPNPASAAFSFKTGKADAFNRVELISMQGELVQVWETAQTTYAISPQIGNGNYLVKVFTDKSVYTSRLTVIR